MQQYNQEFVTNLQKTALQAKADILTMTTLAASGHPGGAMSTLDTLLAVYNTANINPQNRLNPDRDYVVVSHGHVSPAVYSVLASKGFFERENAIAGFRKAGSIFEGHIETDVPGVEWGTGNLGQGLSAACGFALAKKIHNQPGIVYTFMGDGEQQKGQIAEARRFAVKYKLPMIAVVDYNRLQISGDISGVMPQNIKAGWEADGWYCLEIDGHDYQQILSALQKARQNTLPTLILARTVMSKGVSFMENKAKYHGSPLNEEDLGKALEELGMPNKLQDYRQLRQSQTNHKASAKRHYQIDINPGSPKTYTKPTDNRSAWGNALADIATTNPDANLAVFDCDLAGSVKTGDYAGNNPQKFFQAGISEHHTAVCAGALSFTGAQVFWADFGVFGVDEVYNQLRLNDINHTNLKVITTHVGLDVGEDGKTHQCIDYIGLMRNLYHFEILIGADPNQTDRIVRWMATQPGNFYLPMGRSKIEPLRYRNGELVYGEDYKFVHGKADMLRDGNDAALLVTGALATQAIAASDKLAEEGISLRVYNISSLSKLDEAAIKEAAQLKTVFTLEDHNAHTGLGSLVAGKMMDLSAFCQLYRLGVEEYAFSGNADDVIRLNGLDALSIYQRVKEAIQAR